MSWLPLFGGNLGPEVLRPEDSAVCTTLWIGFLHDVRLTRSEKIPCNRRVWIAQSARFGSVRLALLSLGGGRLGVSRRVLAQEIIYCGQQANRSIRFRECRCGSQ